MQSYGRLTTQLDPEIYKLGTKLSRIVLFYHGYVTLRNWWRPPTRLRVGALVRSSFICNKAQLTIVSKCYSQKGLLPLF